MRTFVKVSCSNGFTFSVDGRAAAFWGRLLTFFNTHNQAGVTCRLAPVQPPVVVGPPG